MKKTGALGQEICLDVDMTPVHFHLALNHFPIILGMLGPILILLGKMRRKIEWVSVGCGILIAAAILVGPVYLSGEKSEHFRVPMPPTQKHYIHEHEESAEVALTLTIVAGVMALGLLVVRNRKILDTSKLNIFEWLLLFTALVNVGFLANTGLTGGKIRHTEIRDPNVVFSPDMNVNENPETPEN